jgi:hypothetical protein
MSVYFMLFYALKPRGLPILKIVKFPTLNAKYKLSNPYLCPVQKFGQ